MLSPNVSRSRGWFASWAAFKLVLLQLAARPMVILAVAATGLTLAGGGVGLVLVQQRQDIRPLAGNPLPPAGTPSVCGGTYKEDTTIKTCLSTQFSTETGCINSCQCGYTSGSCSGKSEGSSCYQDSNCNAGLICQGGRVAVTGESPTRAAQGTCVPVTAPGGGSSPSCASGWSQQRPSSCSPLQGVFSENQNGVQCYQCRERQRINAGVKCTAQQGCICATGPDQGDPKALNQTCAANTQIECWRAAAGNNQCQKSFVNAASCNPTAGNYATPQACGSAIGNAFCYSVTQTCSGAWSPTANCVAANGHYSTTTACTTALSATGGSSNKCFSLVQATSSNPVARCIESSNVQNNGECSVPQFKSRLLCLQALAEQNNVVVTCYDALNITEPCKKYSGTVGSGACLNPSGQNAGQSRYYTQPSECQDNVRDKPTAAGIKCSSANGCLCIDGPDAGQRRSLNGSYPLQTTFPGVCRNQRQVCIDIKGGGQSYADAHNRCIREDEGAKGTWDDVICDCKRPTPSPTTTSVQRQACIDIKGGFVNWTKHVNDCQEGENGVRGRWDDVICDCKPGTSASPTSGSNGGSSTQTNSMTMPPLTGENPEETTSPEYVPIKYPLRNNVACGSTQAGGFACLNGTTCLVCLGGEWGNAERSECPQTQSCYVPDANNQEATKVVAENTTPVTEATTAQPEAAPVKYPLKNNVACGSTQAGGFACLNGTTCLVCLGGEWGNAERSECPTTQSCYLPGSNEVAAKVEPTTQPTNTGSIGANFSAAVSNIFSGIANAFRQIAGSAPQTNQTLPVPTTPAVSNTSSVNQVLNNVVANIRNIFGTIFGGGSSNGNSGTTNSTQQVETLVGVSGGGCYCKDANNLNYLCTDQALCCSNPSFASGKDGLCAPELTEEEAGDQLLFGDVYEPTSQIGTNPYSEYGDPSMIIWHTSGANDDTVQPVISTINNNGYGCQFAVGLNDERDDVITAQLAPMAENGVLKNGCTAHDDGHEEETEYRSNTINIEMAGLPNQVNPQIIAETVELTANLAEQYNMCFADIAGHLEESAAGKPDPGQETLALLRAGLEQELQARGRTDLLSCSINLR